MSRIRANTITNQNANGAPNFPDGITVTGVVTATTTNQNITGDLSVTGNVGVGGTLTYEDVTNIDSVGIITARSGVNVSGGEVKVGTAVTVSSGGVITSGIVTATNVSAASSVTAATFHGSGANLSNLPASGKATNLVINGAMTVAQAGTSADVGSRLLDRFGVYKSGTDETPTQAQVDVASGTTPYTLGFRKALKITNGNQTSGAGAGDRLFTSYQFEAQDLATSGWNYTSSSSYVTLSFWVKSSVAQTFHGYLSTQDGTQQGYSFETGSLTANTWTKVTKTISGNSNLQFDNDNGSGLSMIIGVYWGTNYTDAGNTMNQWAAYSGSSRMPDNTTTWYTTNDATFEFTGVLLEVGDSASDFPHETYAETILKCYRYYYAHKGMLWGITSAGDHLDLNLTYPVPMRTTPSRTQVDTSLLFKNRLDQENSTSASTYSYPGAVSPTGDFWVARPGSGDAWGINYTTTDTHAVYWHPHEGTTSYAWSAEL